MRPVRFRLEQTVLACSLPLMAAGAGALWLLRRPSSWLSRAVDDAMTLPAGSRR